MGEYGKNVKFDNPLDTIWSGTARLVIEIAA